MTSAKTDEALLKCIDTTNNALKISVSSTTNQVTTVDDTTESVYSNDEKEHTLNGSGDNFTVLFKDSETGKLWTVGQSKTVFNNSSEVAIVTDDNASFFEFLVPRATATVRCKVAGIGTTEFDYIDDSNMLPASVCTHSLEEWSYARSGISYAYTNPTDGSNGSGGIQSSAIAGTYSGVSYNRTNSGAAGTYSLLAGAQSFIPVGSGAILMQSRMIPSNVGTNPNELILWDCSLSDTISGNPGTAPTNAIRIRFDSSDATYPDKFVGNTWVAGTEYLAVASPVTVFANSLYSLAVIISSTGDRVDFYVNQALVGTLINDGTTRIPSGNLRYNIGIEAIGAGTTNRAIYQDNHRIHQNLTTKRG